MLRFSDQQIRQFSDIEYERFVDDMVDHAKSIAPEAHRIVGDAEFRTLVYQALDDSAQHDLTLRGSLRLYLELRLMLGHGLRDDPQTPWVLDILSRLEDTADAEIHRAELLHMKAEQYVKHVHGPDDCHIKAALERLDAFAEAAQTRSFDGSHAEAIHYAREIHPQKMDYIGDDAVVHLVAFARMEAQRAGLESGRTVALLTLMMMSFGHRCTTDPLYPWIGEALLMHAEQPVEERASRFERRAKTWLRQVRRTQMQAAEAALL
ncbi:MAG: hypothetical protein AAF714_03820 [Pseudomonadota bacterium]